MTITAPRFLRTRSITVSRSSGAWEPQSGKMAGYVLASLRSAAILLWSVIAIPVQALLLVLPGPAKIWFAKLFWAVFCRIYGVKVRNVGASCHLQGRPVIYVSNHCSWLDVGVLGAHLNACFVSKDDVASWPLVNIIARLGRTVYVSRQRSTTVDESRTMRGRLARGDNLILFPEGTTSDGSRVMPFRSSFLSAAEGEPAPLVQPISVVYDRLAGLPAVRSTRPLFAYYGDMAIGPHFWRLAQCRGMRATVLLHDPIDPRDYPDRKALTRAVWNIVATGAATLRQNRTPTPLRAEPARSKALGDSAPGDVAAFA